MKITHLATALRNEHLEAIADLEVLVKVDEGDYRPIEAYIQRRMIGDKMAVILTTAPWAGPRKRKARP